MDKIARHGNDESEAGRVPHNLRPSTSGRLVDLLPLAVLLIAVGCSDDNGTGNGGTPDAGNPDANTNIEAVLDMAMHQQIATVQAGQVTCAALAEAYLQRVAERDEGPTGINAMIAMNADLLTEAAAIDALDNTSSPLACGLIAVKDNIDIAGTPTTAGSLAMVDNLVSVDAPVIAALRGQGAVFFGKANLSEWANFRGTGSSSGWSSLGGQTRNGAAPEYNPCGSSSGSAAAVAAGLVAAALGTETNGSITCPAAINGTVGFKPTVGLVSRTGVIPLAPSFDTVGSITTTVTDAAYILSAIAGSDPADPATADIPADFDSDFVAALQGASFAGLRIGYSSTELLYYELETATVFLDHLDAMEAAGATVINVDLLDPSPIFNDLFLIFTTEFKHYLNEYLAARPNPTRPSTLAELIAFNNDNAAAVMPHFGQEYFENAQASVGIDDPSYLQAAVEVPDYLGRDGLLALLDSENLDVLVQPTVNGAWMTDYVNGDPPGPNASFLPAIAGYPHLTVPMGMADGLPVGMSFIGRPWSDGDILRHGRAFELLD